MKNDKNKVQRSILFILLFTILITVPTAAQNRKADVDITYRNIVIYSGSSHIIPKDPNGKYIEPFILNGSVYLPLRAVGQAVGYQVRWDAETSTVLLEGAAPGSEKESAPQQVKLSERVVFTAYEDKGKKAVAAFTLLEAVRGDEALRKYPDALTYHTYSTNPVTGIEQDRKQKTEVPDGYELLIVKVKAEFLEGTGDFTERAGISFHSSQFQYGDSSSVKNTTLISLPNMLGGVMTPGANAELYLTYYVKSTAKTSYIDYNKNIRFILET